MTILEALKELTQSIIDWVSNKISKEKEEIQKELNEKIAEIQPADGMSAFEIALQNGFDGTKQEWLASLKGDPGKDYVLTEADKQEIAAMVNVDVSCPVTSVNGHTGEVQLSAEDVGALSEKIVIPTKVSELANDKGYITNYVEIDPTVPGWAKASSKPSYSKSEVGLGNVDNVKQYSVNNPPPYPVTSVNGQTGAVTITTLPAVTTNDNGKVLMVVGGTWKLVDLNLSVDSNGVLSV